MNQQTLARPVATGIDDGPLPEEEPLFREFQAYVRAIQVASTEATVKVLTHGVQELQSTVSSLNQVVVSSRERYVDLFAPAVASFEKGVKVTLDRIEADANAARSLMAALQAEALQSLRAELSVTEERLSTKLTKQLQFIQWLTITLGVAAVALFMAFLVSRPK